MMHVVLKRFTWCPDGTGITSEDLVQGDEREFGDITQSLVDEGYIEPVKGKKGRGKAADNGGATTPSDLDKLTDDELTALAEERQIDISGAVDRAAIIAAIEAAEKNA